MAISGGPVIVSVRSAWLAAGIATLSLLVATANADTRKVYDNELSVVGVRVSKSGSVRLAEASREGITMLERPVYLPAGTRLIVFKETTRDSHSRAWSLAFTEDGLLVYVRTDGTHYFEEDVIARYIEEHGQIAIAETNLIANTELYGPVEISTSEIFSFNFLQDDYINISITKDSSIRQVYTEDDLARVYAFDFSIITRDRLSIDDIVDPFVEYDFRERLEEIKELVANLRRPSEEEKTQFVSYVENRFVTQKECVQKIEYSWAFSGNAALEFSNILSPLTAGLGLSGNYSTTSTFDVGTAFEIQRFKSGGTVVEIRDEQIFRDGDCAQPSGDRRISAYQANKAKGELNRLYLTNYLRFTESGLPIYTCRDEYLALMHSLTRDQELDRSTAALLIAKYARYEGAGDAAVCTDRSTARELVPRPRPVVGG